MMPADYEAIFQCLQQQRPAPESELHYRNTFELLVAVILSAQSTDREVNKVTARLFAVAPTPQALVALGGSGLKPYLQTLGLHNAKTQYLLKSCELLLSRHQGQVPDQREALEALPGVGRKTANVILNTAFGQATIAVDTHIFRVANRMGLAPGKTVQAVETGLMAVVPAQFMRHAHHWLVLHGRYTCKARKPLCAECVVRSWCEYPDKQLTT